MKKKFDAVKFQRKVREELSERYLSGRETFLRELARKYGSLQREKADIHRGKFPERGPYLSLSKSD